MSHAGFMELDSEGNLRDVLAEYTDEELYKRLKDKFMQVSSRPMTVSTIVEA